MLSTLILFTSIEGQRQKEGKEALLFLHFTLGCNRTIMVLKFYCFNYYGFYVGSFYPRESNVSGHLLVRQVEYYLDPQKRLTLAKEFVSGALFHIRRNLNYYRNRGKQVDEAIKVVEACMERIESCRSITELMSEEGRAREAYYGAFNEILALEQPFEKRVRRPPENMVNPLLSFGNSLLYTATLSEIYVTQLNPTISYLH